MAENWRYTHGEDFAVPDILTSVEGWEDVSYRNDASPSFEHVVHDGDTIGRRFILWAGHPEAGARDIPGQRFLLQVAFCDPSGGESDDDPVPILYTDDAETVAAVMHAVAHQPGSQR